MKSEKVGVFGPKLVCGLFPALLFVAFFAGASFAQNLSVSSPNKRLRVEFALNADGAPRYSVTLDGKAVLLESMLGLVREDADFSAGLKLVAASKPEAVRDRYELLTIKRRLNDYRATRVVYQLRNAAGKNIEIVFQVSDDGVAFRYRFPETDAKTYRIKEEKTSYRFPSDAKAWLQPMAKARTGWKESQPSYEEYYEQEIPVGTPSTLGAGWIYPALFRSNEIWALVSESGFARNYCGTRLGHDSTGGEYRVAFPDPLETRSSAEPVNPESTLPWATPWRIVAVGTLATIAESTLGTDVAPAAVAKADALAPGKASWSWVLMGDNETKYDTQKRFIDYAAAMNWQYCLIDALWDTQIGYEKIKELTDYARTKKVKIILWYNSAGDWNSTPQTPRGRLLTHADRMKEFARLKEIGISGLKIDFFGGDGQSFMNYYIDLIEDAARFGFVVNFHGATLPRGLERTYPNLMTMEAIRGFEFVTFEQRNADNEPTHSAMLPFTRNAFDPMDFTPVALERVNSRITRRTTSGFELALSVLFTSGVTHYAETPEGMAKAPDYVREFMKRVPRVWDDVKFIDGYPGRFVVLARRAGKQWFIAGINGGDAEKTITIDPRRFAGAGAFELIEDGAGGNLSFANRTIRADRPFTVTLRPRGGFVATGGKP
ncbi:MAG: glycoside hydrolase family 97 catalytic domain-containing protein [Acidobacteria bacterium]|nr:glycoside hydrolase family 97 catalytic domain-containing protein [Acidobacteriota bacterium]